MGSMTAPTAVGMPSSGSTLVAGMTMYSANAPSRSSTVACMAGIRGSGKWEGSEDGAGEAPVHLDHGAGNVTGAFRGQEHDDRSELVGAAHAPHRNVGGHLAHDFL